MNKTDLVKAVAEKSGYRREDMNVVLKALEDVVVEAVTAQDEVKLFTGLTIRGTQEEARVCRNPQNGNPIHVPAHTGVKVKVTKYFKDRVNP